MNEIAAKLNYSFILLNLVKNETSLSVTHLM